MNRVSWQNLHILIHSVPLRTNLIHWYLSHSISYCHVAIHSVPIHPNRLCHILSCFVAKPPHCDPFSSFQFLSIPFTSFQFLSVPFCSFQFLSFSFIFFWLLLVPFGYFQFLSFIFSSFGSFWFLSVTFGSFWFRSVHFCPNLIYWLSSSFIVYCRVFIHFVPSRHNRIHYIPSHCKAEETNIYSGIDKTVLIFMITRHCYLMGV